MGLASAGLHRFFPKTSRAFEPMQTEFERIPALRNQRP